MGIVCVSAAEALNRIPRSSLLVASPGCGAPDTLLRAIPEVCAGHDWTLFTGLLLGDYPFLDAVEDEDLRYLTFHVMRPARAAVSSGKVGFLPLRYSQVGRLIRSWAERRPLVALVRLTPPDAHGQAS